MFCREEVSMKNHFWRFIKINYATIRKPVFKADKRFRYRSFQTSFAQYNQYSFSIYLLLLNHALQMSIIIPFSSQIKLFLVGILR